MIKGVTHADLEPIWYHSEPSDVPYSLNQFLGWRGFFVPSYSNTALGIGIETVTFLFTVKAKGHLISECLDHVFKFSKNLTNLPRINKVVKSTK